ncbi:MAG: DUF4954 family protein, partial [Sedimentisphaerales bacterium]|nr:DUF4954 family protein [Sedimentisphaerales bacterium]
MSGKQSYGNLTEKQIDILQKNGCAAQDWTLVKVADGFDPQRVRNTHFLGQIFIGCLKGSVLADGEIEKPSGIYNATIANCIIADDS